MLLPISINEKRGSLRIGRYQKIRWDKIVIIL